MANNEAAAGKKNGRKALYICLAVILVLVIIFLCIFIPKNNKHRDDYFCQYAKEFSVSKVEGGENTVLVAHRGLSSKAPENTLPAYVEAAKAGYKFVETDIMTTKDNVWVISHDDNLVRMTGYDGEIKDMTLKEVQSHPIIEGANIKKYKNLVTPTFDEWIKCLKENDLYPVIEMKLDDPNAPYENVINILKKYDMLDRTTFISFEKEPMLALRKLDKNVKMMWLSDNMDTSAIAFAEQLGNCGLDIDYNSVNEFPDVAKKAIDEGLVLNVWTVDDKKPAEEAVANGVTFLTTNCILPDAKEEAFVKNYIAQNF